MKRFQSAPSNHVDSHYFAAWVTDSHSYCGMFWLDPIPFGPPPEDLLAEWWKWICFMILLSSVWLLQILSSDYVDIAVTGILILFGWRMLRDNMKEMPVYVLVYAVLCGLDCCFTLLPLLGCMVAGRIVDHHVQAPVVHLNGTKLQSWTTYSEVVGFFDWSRGFRFNAQAFSTLLTPIVMALGCGLSIMSYMHVERMMSFEEDVDTSEIFDTLRSPAERLLPRVQRPNRDRAFSGKVFKVES